MLSAKTEENGGVFVPENDGDLTLINAKAEVARHFVDCKRRYDVKNSLMLVALITMLAACEGPFGNDQDLENSESSTSMVEGSDNRTQTEDQDQDRNQGGS